MFLVSRENFPTSQNLKYKIYPKVLTFHLHVKIGFCSIISFPLHVLNLWSHIKNRFQFHTKIGPCSIFLSVICIDLIAIRIGSWPYQCLFIIWKMKLLMKVLNDLFKELEVPLSIGIESRYTIIPICDVQVLLIHPCRMY